MKLFYKPLSSSLASHIVLRELDLPFALDRVDSATKTTESAQDYLSINPKGYVPALQLDDGSLLTEGPAIMQYLADRYAPDTLAPLAGTLARAQVDAYLHFIGTELHTAFAALFALTQSAQSIQSTGDAAARAAAVTRLHRGFTLIERDLARQGPYLSGPRFTLPDAYLYVVQNWAPMVGFDLAPFPHLATFARCVAARPAVQAALAAERDAIARHP